MDRDIRSVCQVKGKVIVMNVMRRVFRRGIGNGEGTVGRVRRGLAAVGVAAAAAGLLALGAGQANASTAFTVHVTPTTRSGCCWT